MSTTTVAAQANDKSSLDSIWQFVAAIAIAIALIIIVLCIAYFVFKRFCDSARSQRRPLRRPLSREHDEEELWTSRQYTLRATTAPSRTIYDEAKTQESVYDLPTMSSTQIENNILDFFKSIREDKSFAPFAHFSQIDKECGSGFVYKERCAPHDAHKLTQLTARNKKYLLRETTRLRMPDQPNFVINASVAGRRGSLILAEEPMGWTTARTYLAALHHNVSVMLMAGEMDPNVSWIPVDPPIVVKYEKDVDVTVSNDMRGLAPEHGIHRTQLMVRSDALSLGPVYISHLHLPRLTEYSSGMPAGKLDEELVAPIAVALNEILPLPAGQKIMIFSRDGARLASLLACSLEIAEPVMEGMPVDPFAVSRAIRLARDEAFDSSEGFVFSILLALKMLSLRLKSPPQEVLQTVNDYEQQYVLLCRGLRHDDKSTSRTERCGTGDSFGVMVEATQASETSLMMKSESNQPLSSMLNELTSRGEHETVMTIEPITPRGSKESTGTEHSKRPSVRSVSIHERI